MVTKQNIKDLHALGMKKHRDATHSFVAEGPKVVGDLLPHMRCKTMYATQSYLDSINSLSIKNVECVEVIDKKTLERLSLLSLNSLNIKCAWNSWLICHDIHSA